MLFLLMPIGDTSPLYLSQVDSTNSYALSHLSHLAHHSLIVADEQTAGRGRQNRQWISQNSGNLYMTLVEKPGSTRDNSLYQNFTQLFAVAVCTACRGWDFDARIKWPNDILVQGKKLGGILSESRFSGSSLIGLVIGLGLNITNAPHLDDRAVFPATCLSELSKREINREKVIDDILSAYFDRYEAFLSKGFLAIYTEYQEYLGYTDGELFLEHYNPEIPHSFAGLTSQGELIVKDPSGEEIHVRSGEVQWMR